MESRLVAIARRYGLESVYVFGSRAEEIAGLVAAKKLSAAPRATSDVDVGVEPHGALGWPPRIGSC